MEISSWLDVVWNESSNIYSFTVTADGIEIRCYISSDVVEKNFELKSDDPILRGCLNATFMVGKAAQLIRAGRFEQDGSICITDLDFEGGRRIREQNIQDHDRVDISAAKLVFHDCPEVESLTASEAAKWYRCMVSLLPLLSEDLPPNLQKLEYTWRLKRAIRKIAALAMYDQELIHEFYESFPIPSLENIQLEICSDSENILIEHALQELASLSESEKRKYPGTIGEAIGMEWRKDKNTTYVMTELGWLQKK